MALSAPNARAVLNVSLALRLLNMCSSYCLGPIDKAITSETFLASLSLIASSKAISQNGFIDILTLAISTPSGLTRTYSLFSSEKLLSQHSQ